MRATKTILRAAGALGVERPLRRAHAATRGREQRRNWRDDDQLGKLIATLPADADCVDVGANVGTILAQIVRAAPRGRHVAFEPLPNLAAELRARFPRVEVRCAALADRAGRREFVHVTDRASRSGFHPGGYDEEGFATATISVDVETLDGALPDGCRPRLIKLDVEGAELDALRGAEATIARHRPIIAFEHANPTVSGEIHDLLARHHRLRILDMDGGGPLGRDAFVQMVQANARWNFVAQP